MNVLAGPRLVRSNSAHNSLPPLPLRSPRISPETNPRFLAAPGNRPSLGDLLINHSPVIAIDERLCRASLGALSAHGGIRQISWRLYRWIIDRTLLDRLMPVASMQLTTIRLSRKTMPLHTLKAAYCERCLKPTLMKSFIYQIPGQNSVYNFMYNMKNEEHTDIYKIY